MCGRPVTAYAHVLDRLGEWAERGGGAWFRCPFGRERHRNGDRHWSGRAKVGGRGQLVVRCFACGAGWMDFARYGGMRWWECFPDGQPRWLGEPPRRRRVKAIADHRYEDAAGRLIAVKRRYAPGGDRKCDWMRPVPLQLLTLAGTMLPEGGRACAHALSAGRYYPVVRGRDRHYYPLRHGQDEPAGCIDLPAAAPSLYRLPTFAAVGVHENTLWLVEGEGKADLLASLGLAVTSPPHGSSLWEPAWATHWAGRRAVLVPDNDPPGLELMDYACGTILRAGAESVAVLVPGHGGYDPPADGGDVKDWLLAMPRDRWAAALARVVAAAPVYRRAG